MRMTVLRRLESLVSQNVPQKLEMSHSSCFVEHFIEHYLLMFLGVKTEEFGDFFLYEET